MSYLIIDTNIFESINFNLESLSFYLLELFIEKHRFLEEKDQIKVHLPIIICQEVEKRYKSNLKKTYKEFEKTYKELNKFPLDKEQIEINIDIDTETKSFIEKFKKGLKEKLANFEIIDETEFIGLNDLKNRCIQCKKPFSPDGKLGFRDSIIWEFVKHYSNNKNEQIIFISNDTDFLKKKKNEIHDELQEEINNQLVIYRRLSELEIEKAEERLEEYENYFDSSVINDLVKEPIVENIQDYIEFPHTYDSSEVNTFNVSNIEIERAIKFNDNTDIIKINFDLSIDIDLYVYKSDLYIEESLGDFEIWSDNYNEWYTLLMTSKEYNVQLLIQYDHKKEDIENFEIVKLSEYIYDSASKIYVLKD